MARDYLEVKLESTHFPHEHLHVRRFEGREVVSRLFDFELDLVSLDRQGIDTAAMMGANVTLSFHWSGAEIRRIRGMIAAVHDRQETQGTLHTVRARVVPRAFRLTLIETQETFMDMTVPEIIAHKLHLVGLGKDLELRLSHTYPKREFVVQYGETDLAFVSRLAEHLGISFFFEHHDGHERMIFTDHPGGFRRPGDGAPSPSPTAASTPASTTSRPTGSSSPACTPSRTTTTGRPTSASPRSTSSRTRTTAG